MMVRGCWIVLPRFDRFFNAMHAGCCAMVVMHAAFRYVM